MISFKVAGAFSNLESFLKRSSSPDILAVLHSCGEEGVSALSSATPTDTGLAAGSWSYDASAENGVYTLYWTNSDIESEFPVAIMLQYGYGTGTGGYVQGRDYINPATAPIFDQIEAKVWKAVTSQ